jgi:hypothetical protein
MARLEWHRAIRADGRHNAVTDLARWRGHVYLCHRVGVTHWNHPPGAVRVLRSADLETWEPCGSLDGPLDLRDPKLVADGDRLLLYFASVRLELGPEGAPVAGGEKELVSRACWTTDGVTWSDPVATYAPRWWLWRPARFEDGFWCAAYGAGGVHLLRSDDGLAWRRGVELLPPGLGNEAALLRLPDRRTVAVVRGVGDETFVLESDPPYHAWGRRRVAHWMQAPCAALVGGRAVVAGRARTASKDYVARLWELSGEFAPRALLDLPSGGDCSYCGLVPDGDDALLVSWYSQHSHMGVPGFAIGKAPADVYLGRVVL